MTMKYKQWKEILSAINNEADLSKGNVIEKVKEKLKVIDSSAYEEWEKTDFDVNYLFQVENIQCALLHLVAYGNLGNVAGALLKVEGINVNAKGKDGWTPLHFAAQNGHKEIVDALLAKEDDVNAKGKDGRTPLHLAARNGHTEVVKILIANGVDPLLKNKDGKTPRDLAERDFIKKLLKEAEEKQLKQQALNKSISAGGATALLGTAAAVALFVTGTVAVEL